MRKLIVLAALAAATAITSPALAGNSEGKWQVKVLGTGVLPDGKVKNVPTNLTSIPTSAIDTRANDNVVPTLAIEYFASPNFSIETICCFTQHKVNGAGGIQGTSIVRHVLILPATVTAKYHLQAGPIKPYIGAGPAVFFVFGEKPGSTLAAAPFNVDRVRMTNEVGVALQAGVDIPVNENGLGISIDAKRYFIRPSAKFYVGSTKALETKHKLDPWVVSAGLTYRFGGGGK